MEKENEPLEPNDVELEAIAILIQEGNTYGKLGDSEGRHVAWELKTNVWKQ